MYRVRGNLKERGHPPITFCSVFSNAHSKGEGASLPDSSNLEFGPPHLGQLQQFVHHKLPWPRPAMYALPESLLLGPRLPSLKMASPHSVPTQIQLLIYYYLHILFPQNVSLLSHLPPTKRHGDLIEKVWISELYASGFKSLPCLLVVK